MSAPEINIPEVVAEVEAALERYERALVGNDIAVLTELFWQSPKTIRYGIGENLVGWDTIAAFRQNRPPVDLDRELSETVITTYGRGFATANTEYRRKNSSRRGRQSQTWARMAEGWRIVAAHVSLLPD